jgi:hypothetical protein
MYRRTPDAQVVTWPSLLNEQRSKKKRHANEMKSYITDAYEEHKGDTDMCVTIYRNVANIIQFCGNRN